jgi:hypothetical protein
MEITNISSTISLLQIIYAKNKIKVYFNNLELKSVNDWAFFNLFMEIEMKSCQKFHNNYNICEFIKLQFVVGILTI